MGCQEPASEGSSARRALTKGVIRRAEILEAALELFASGGPRGASLRKIAQRLGLTDGAVMYHFGSRDELFLAVIDEYERRALARTEFSPDFRDGLVRALRANLDVPGLVRLHVSLAAAASEPGHPAGPHFTRRYAALRELLGEQLRALQQSGRARADIPAEVLAKLVLAAIDGLQVQWLVDPECNAMEVIDALVLMICGPVLPHSSAEDHPS